jgi:phage-related protein
MYAKKNTRKSVKKIKDVIKKTFQCIFQNYSMEIRKVHILARHFFNGKDNSAGIFFTEEDGGVDWLWSVIEETVGLFINDIKEFRKRGGQTFDKEQRRVILEMPMTSLVRLSMGPERTEVTGVF